METINLTCIGCPMGCPLTVTMENGEVKDVTGNTCKRGDDYARKEVTNPTRIVTSTVICEGGKIDAVSVKTKSDIPKGKIFDAVSYTHLFMLKEMYEQPKTVRDTLSPRIKDGKIEIEELGMTDEEIRCV